jgi:hypothetical protein
MFRGKIIQNNPDNKGVSVFGILFILITISFVYLLAYMNVSSPKNDSIMSDVGMFKKAVNKFEKKYDALPGDIKETSELQNAVQGNGNGIIEEEEALNFWHHLAASGLIDSSFDGISEKTPDKGVPASKIKNAVFNLKTINSINADYNLTNKSVVIELAKLSDDKNNLAILKPSEAKSLDENFDDGNPLTGKILADENKKEDCILNGGYNLSINNVSCRILFVIKKSKSTDEENIESNLCSVIDQTRQLNAPLQKCPEGFEGKIIETCKMFSENKYKWEVTDESCEEITCSDGKYKDKRKLSCINGTKDGEGITQECTANGIWKTISSDCKNGENLSCNSSVDTKRTRGCDFEESGHIMEVCTDNKWVTKVNTCKEIKCGSDSIGDSKLSVESCGNGYIGNMVEICTISGEWVTTSVGATCVPDYSGKCKAGETKDIGCPIGKKGSHTIKCIESETNHWTTEKYSCEAIKCSPNHNLGSVRINENSCPGDSKGVVTEYCKEIAGRGLWVQVYSNCVDSICPPADDLLGNAHWPATTAGQEVKYTKCVAGYKISGDDPKRTCNQDGTWSDDITNPCVRKTCPDTEINNAKYKSATAGDKNLKGVCNSDFSAPDNFPLMDCSIEGKWTNERLPCQPIKSKKKEDQELTLPVKAPNLWLDASDENTIFSDYYCTKNIKINSPVRCWQDKSGNNFHARQKTLNRTPQYVRHKITNKNVIKFNLDHLDNQNFSAGDDFSIFAAVTTNKNNPGSYPDRVIFSNHYNITLGTKGGEDSMKTAYGNGIRWTTFNNNGHGSYSRLKTANKFYVLSSVLNNNINTPFLNGSIVDSTETKMSPFSNGFWLGQQQFFTGNVNDWDGNIAEIITYNRALTLKERLLTENYLGKKWGVEIFDIKNFLVESILWLDANDPKTIFSDKNCSTHAVKNGYVGCWQDKSGRNNHAKQIEKETKRPLYKNNSMNSNPVIEFSPADNNFLLIKNEPNKDFDITGNVTFFFATKFNGIGMNWGTMFSKTSVPGEYAQPFDMGTYAELSSSKWRLYFDIGDGTDFGTMSAESTDASINIRDDFIITFSTTGPANTHRIYINGYLNSETTHNINMTGGPDIDVYLGAFNDSNDTFDGEMAEIIVFNKLIQKNTRESVEAYLGDKWGIKINH